tara:strand:+ start:857 stop:1372 length:516 start_codon:yes stop_codon:yes gene_type:complete
MNLNLEKLSISRELFEPYGDIISKGMESNRYIINQGYCERFDEVAAINLLDKKAKPIISIFSATPRKRPIKIDYLEMHPLSSQAFMPIQKMDWLAVVANDNHGSPDLSSIKCFGVPGDVGISYNPSVWHFPLLVNTAQDFLVIDRSSESDKNKENLREFSFQNNDKSIYID